MIKTVIFDLGRVIVPFDFQRAYRLMEARCGIPAAEIPDRIRPSGLVQRYECGLIESEPFVQELSAILGLKMSYSDFCEIWSAIFLPHTLVSDELIAGLAKHYRVILLSNTNEIHFLMLRENYPILRHFHAFVLSHEVRSMKPAPEIYQAAIAEARCLPEECFFTDDILENVIAAREQGIDAVQFHSGEQIEEELRSRGVTWV